MSNSPAAICDDHWYVLTCDFDSRPALHLDGESGTVARRGIMTAGDTVIRQARYSRREQAAQPGCTTT